MATTIKLKNGSGAPLAGDLVQGEPAFDLTNKRLYTEDSGGTVIEVGTNPGTDVTFDDNRKAIFGAGSDLQIYHDGSNSYIAEGGTGSLQIQGQNLSLEDSTGTRFFLGIQGGETRLYNQGNQKVAVTSTGIDVTGTVTSDGLTVDGIAEISSTTPTLRFFETDQTDEGTLLRSAGDSFQIAKMLDTGAADGVRFEIDQSSGDISFYEDTGTTQAFFWDASTSRLGIGTTSPSARFHLLDTSSQMAIFGSTSTSTYVQFRSATTTTRGYIGNGSGLVTGASNSDFIFRSQGDAVIATGGNTERMRIDSSGNVGIGTTPNQQGSTKTLHIQDSSGATVKLEDGTDEFDIQNVGGTAFLVNRSANPISFYTNSTERMRIDSSGNVGIGTTPNANAKFEVVSTNAGAVTNVIQLRNGDATAGSGAKLQFLNSTVNYATAGTSEITGVRYSGNYSALTFTTYGPTSLVERMRIDGVGNVGIGTTSPGYKLQLNSVGDNDGLLIKSGSASYINYLLFGDSGSNTVGRLGYNHANNSMTFFTSDTERMRIDSSGNLLVGTTDNTPYNNGTSTSADKGICLGNGFISTANYNASAADFNRTGTDGNIVNFYKNGATKGNISITSSAVAYNTTSDERLKENIVDAPAGNIDAIRVRSFDWKADGTHQTYGMVAQELVDVAPEAVSQGDTEDDMWGVDYSKLVPMMIKEIQDLRARVAQLEGA